jgi:hypothetical protein
MKKLYLTYCSAEKRSGVYPPERLYISDRITRFINRCSTVGVDWAILSALYGFFFPDEERKDYNVTFRTDRKYWLDVAVIRNQQKLSYNQSKQHIAQLAETLKLQGDKRSFDKIIFYGPSPMMMKCYLEILHYAFDGCAHIHGWSDLIEHVKKKSDAIRIIHRVEDIRKTHLDSI